MNAKTIRHTLLQWSTRPGVKTALDIVERNEFEPWKGLLAAKTRKERLAAGAYLSLDYARRFLSPDGPDDYAQAVGAERFEVNKVQAWGAFMSTGNVSSLTVSDLSVYRNSELPGIFACVMKYDAPEEHSRWYSETPDGQKRLVELMTRVAWEAGDHLTFLGDRKSGREVAVLNIPGMTPRHRSSPTRMFAATPPADTYVGSPQPANYAQEIKRGSTTLIVGPSGAGKTTFARHLVSEVSWAKRSLTIPGNRINALAELVRDMKPCVLIIDDIPLTRHVDYDMLEEMEQLRPHVGATILTFMSDEPEESYLKPGGLYWPGMRPGRIDRILTLGRPDAEKRFDILRAYLPEVDDATLRAMSEASSGMTGAYLRALADNVTDFGIECWPERLRLLTYQMPRGEY